MPTLTNFSINGDLNSIEISPVFDAYSKVTIKIDDNTEVSVGTDIGRELLIECPWGTEEIAENILTSLSGYQYQPYVAQNALIDPAAEIGDAVTAMGIMGGIYRQTQEFSTLMESEASAPSDEEINHEFPYETKVERTVRRLSKETRSELSVLSNEVRAKVSSVGGDPNEFGWSLGVDSWELFSEGGTVLKATDEGIEIRGKVTALSGYIGDESEGFIIDSNAIRNGMTALDDTEHSGVYIGTDGIALGYGRFVVGDDGILYATDVNLTGEIHATSGTIGDGNSVFSIDGGSIRNGMTSLWDSSHDGIYLGTDGIALGKGNFRVDQAGNLTAYSGTFTGSTYASSIKSDGVNGYGGSFSGGGLSSGSVSKGKTGFQSTLNQVGTNQSDIASIKSMFVSTLYCNKVDTDRLTFDSSTVRWVVRNIPDVGLIRYMGTS